MPEKTNSDLWPNIGPKGLEPYTSGVVLIPLEDSGGIMETGRFPDDKIIKCNDVMSFDWDPDHEYRVIVIEFNWGGDWRKDRKFRHLTFLPVGYAIRDGIDITKWGLYDIEDAPLDRVCLSCGTQYDYYHRKESTCPSCLAPEEKLYA